MGVGRGLLVARAVESVATPLRNTQHSLTVHTP